MLHRCNIVPVISPHDLARAALHFGTAKGELNADNGAYADVVEGRGYEAPGFFLVARALAKSAVIYSKLQTAGHMHSMAVLAILVPLLTSRPSQSQMQTSLFNQRVDT